MANTYVNKVIYGGNTLIDLTGDTVAAADLAYGKTAHDKSGAQITGTNTKDSNTTDANATASEILATKTAKDVIKSKSPIKLKPMNSFERRVIHEKLSDWRDVYTESEGEGEDRAIVIKPRLAEEK